MKSLLLIGIFAAISAHAEPIGHRFDSLKGTWKAENTTTDGDLLEISGDKIEITESRYWGGGRYDSNLTCRLRKIGYIQDVREPSDDDTKNLLVRPAKLTPKVIVPYQIIRYELADSKDNSNIGQCLEIVHSRNDQLDHNSHITDVFGFVPGESGQLRDYFTGTTLKRLD